MIFLIILFSYLVGSISFATLIGNYKGIDLKNTGTNNPGATNVYQLIGPGWGIITGIFDFTKGVLPPLVVSQFYPDNYFAIMLAALAVISGHNWPFWATFDGGRGLATTMGTVAVIAFYPGLIAFVIGLISAWIISAKFSREIRIPFITYPLLLIFLLYSGDNLYLWFYGLAIMIISFYRNWQVRDGV